MVNFCAKCGAPLHATSTFCGGCGSPVRLPTDSSASAVPTGEKASPLSPVVRPSLPQKSSSTAKLLVTFVAVIFVGVVLALGGVVYVAHKMSQKAHQLSSRVLNSSSSAQDSLALLLGERPVADTAAHPITGNTCRLLSETDVSHAIGIPIIASHAVDGGCEYLAKGNSSEMTAKHIASMMGSKGADIRQQQMIQKISGGLFSSLQNESKEAIQDADGNLVVFAFSVDPNSAATQMHLNRRVLGGLGPSSQNLPGIGDEAFDVAGAMMMVRKGDRVIRIMYTSCLCTVDAIKPLAQKLADAI